MRRIQEIAEFNSCMNKARDDEMVFVLLARDKAAPYAIREWCKQRIVLGLNKPEDSQIQEALACAETMEKER